MQLVYNTLIDNVFITKNSPLERGRARSCCGGGVLAYMLVNTPLHPSQEGDYNLYYTNV